MKRIAALLLLTLATAVAPSVAQTPSDLDLAKLAVTAHSTGNLLLEQILLRRLMMESSGDLADAARHRLAENGLARGDYGETIRLLNAGDGTADERSPQIRRDRVLIAEANYRTGDHRITESMEYVFQMFADDSTDDAKLAAAKFLDEIEPAVDEGSHFRRGQVYQSNRYWDEARQHYGFVKTTGDAAEALFQIGRGYSQTAEYEKAIPYFQGVIDRFPDTQQAKDSLLQLAAAYSRVNSTDQAISLYQNFIAKYPADDKLDRAYLNIVDIYRDLGDDAHALEWCQKTEAAFTGKTPEALAIFDEAKIYASRSEWQNEIAALDRLKGRNDLGGASQPWGTTAEEVASMREYALRPPMLEDDPRPRSLWPDQRPPINATPSGTTSIVEYPAPYADVILRSARPKSIDPRLLLAVMRQESNFDPQAHSNAAARGLMQFTHPQGVKIAKELGWTYFSDDELYSPANSIMLAVQYLFDLQATFSPQQSEAVVASYNGGEDNVKRWMARAKSGGPTGFVPELVFGQTKDYVAKVMANYRVYQQLYDEQLRTK